MVQTYHTDKKNDPNFFVFVASNPQAEQEV